MYSIKITKTVRRKIAEGAMYFWGIAGLITCFLLARQALEIDALAMNFQGRQASSTYPVMMYTLIWIGGLVFTGFFAALSPVKIALTSDIGNVVTGGATIPDVLPGVAPTLVPANAA